VAREDLDAQFVFQLDDRLRNPRLRRIQRLGGLGEVEILPDGLAHEAKLVQVHL